MTKILSLSPTRKKKLLSHVISFLSIYLKKIRNLIRMLENSKKKRAT